jgi:hypothetical protein
MSTESIRSNCEISSTDGAQARLKCRGVAPGVGSEVLTVVPPTPSPRRRCIGARLRNEEPTPPVVPGVREGRTELAIAVVGHRVGPILRPRHVVLRGFDHLLAHCFRSHRCASASQTQSVNRRFCSGKSGSPLL